MCCNLLRLYSFTCTEQPSLTSSLSVGRSGSRWGGAGRNRVTVDVLASLWLCSRWHYEVLFVQVLLRAGKEGRSQSARSERSLLLLKQLQREEPGFPSHHLRQLLLPPPLYFAVAPAVEADMRWGWKKKEYPESNKSAFLARDGYIS